MAATRTSEARKSEPVITFCATDAAAALKEQPSEEAPALLGEDGPPYASLPWYYRWAALFCFVSLPLGSRWARSCLGPLKNTLRQRLGINNTQFGIITSADSFVDSVFPIVGGVLLDWWGPNLATLYCTSIITAGTFVAAVGVELSLWRVLVGGYIVMGPGIVLLDCAVQKYLYHWFGPAGFALAYGIQNAATAAVTLASGMTAVPIRDSTGHYGWVFWIAAFVSSFSSIMNLVYVVFEHRLVPRQQRLEPARTAAATKRRSLGARGSVSIDALLRMPWQYLMLPGTQLLQNGAAESFSLSAADLIRMKGYTEAVAGFMSTGKEIIRILGSPIVGWLVDRYGHRFHLVATAPLLFIVSNALIGFTDVNPLVALTFSSLATTLNAMPLQICVVMLVADQNKLGTALGLWRAANNASGIVMEVVFGRLQDSTVDMGYDKVLKLGMGLKALGFALGVAYIIVDHKNLGRELTMTRKERERYEMRISDQGGVPRRRRTVWLPATIWTFSVVGAMIIASWVLFIVYLIK